MLSKIQIIVAMLLFLVIAGSCGKKLSAEDWTNKGNALDDQKKYEEAIKCFDKLIELDPNNARVWYYKGVLLYKLGKYEEAIKCFDKTLQINPNYADTKTAKENALKALGK